MLIVIYSTVDEADAYMFYRCFFSVFCFFLFFFPSVTKIPDKYQTAERVFMKLLPNDSGENVVSNVVQKWGLVQMVMTGWFFLYSVYIDLLSEYN